MDSKNPDNLSKKLDYYDLIDSEFGTGVAERLLPVHPCGPWKGRPCFKYNEAQEFLRSIHTLYPDQVDDLAIDVILPKILEVKRRARISHLSDTRITAILYNKELGTTVRRITWNTLPFSFWIGLYCDLAACWVARWLKTLAEKKAQQDELTKLSKSGGNNKGVA